MEHTALISPQDTWVLWTFLIVWSALSIYSEQKYKIAARLSGPVVACIGGLVLANTGVLPPKSPVYDTVWDYIVPLCIPLLLLKADLRRIWRETGRLFGAFHISSLGTVVGAFAAIYAFGKFVDRAPEVAGIMTASYIGGAMNFLATVNIFKMTESTTNALIVADNLVMVVHIIIMLSLPAFVWAVRWFGMLPDEELYLNGEAGSEEQSNYWRPKPISLVDIGKNLALAFLIVTLSTKLSDYISATAIPGALRDFLGNKFLLFTAVTVIFVLLFPGFSSRLQGTEEMGTFAIYLFFVLIGIPASIKAILLQAPILFAFCAVMVGCNMLVTFGLGRLFGYTLPEMILVSIANIAGPMNSAGVAITKKWSKLILPAFLVGIWGYVIGTYLGVIMGNVLKVVF
ncbi:MAG: hypothetical protein A2Z86_00020 [Candidatus Glassbacteria bacterium GWA2_58_10]|uniref:DUF819 domain-containing protein n=1 Tax=Candidatus Glassbacteria bacterium GWA2_58_10 TaxID=1817865 RepID=A0A1F5YE56_9BACT|nr:MAG: hypothetical protein A2Z86_00020 [Candidatus Glassbacteria bacterium GWA2_58_10]